MVGGSDDSGPIRTGNSVSPVDASSNTDEALRGAGIVTNLDRLTGEQRSLLDRTLSLSAETGASPVVVGVVPGPAGVWDLRPLMLDALGPARGGDLSKQGATLLLLRLSDAEAYLDASRKTFIEAQHAAFVRELSSQGALVASGTLGIVSCGLSQGHLWIRRRFFDRLLADILHESRSSSAEFPWAIFSQSLISAVGGLHRAGIVHGHLCPENIGLEDSKPVLLDFCFHAVQSQRSPGLGFLAPELSRGVVPTRASDIYSLGKLLRRVLFDQLSEEHRSLLDSMSHPEPSQRPNINLIEEMFLSPKVQKAPPSAPPRRSLGTVSSSKVRSGKLLGKDGGVHSTSVDSEQDAAALSYGRGAVAGETRSAGHTTRAESAESVRGVVSRDTGITGTGSGVGTSGSKDGLTRVLAQMRRNSVFLILLAVFAIGVGLYIFGGDSFVEREAEHHAKWLSADTTLRREVARAAVIDGDTAAQAVILSDAQGGTIRPGVRLGLLRVAFNSLWTEELSSLDRAQALALALSSLLNDEVPRIQTLKDAHPGVQLAAIGDLSLTLSEGQFSDISTASLARLPAPYGLPFLELQKLGVESMEDIRSRALAQIVVGNFSDGAVQKFLGVGVPAQEFLAHAIIIAPFAELYEAVAADLQRAMAARDDVLARRVEWFRLDPSKQWGQVQGALPVMLSLGLPARSDLALEQYADLLTFPAARVRASAAERLTREFTPNRVGDTLSFLVGDEHRFTRPQVAMLVSLLILAQREPQNPSVNSFFSSWIGTKPDSQSIVGLLVARRDVDGSDGISIELARYLSSRSWEASVSQLRSLAFHKEKLARALAYSRLDASIPDEAKVLQDAARNEQDARLREQIVGKLQSAKLLKDLPASPQTEQLGDPDAPPPLSPLDAEDEEGFLDTPL